MRLNHVTKPFSNFFYHVTDLCHGMGSRVVFISWDCEWVYGDSMGGGGGGGGICEEVSGYGGSVVGKGACLAS